MLWLRITAGSQSPAGQFHFYCFSPLIRIHLYCVLKSAFSDFSVRKKKADNITRFCLVFKNSPFFTIVFAVLKVLLKAIF